MVACPPLTLNRLKLKCPVLLDQYRRNSFTEKNGVVVPARQAYSHSTSVDKPTGKLDIITQVACLN